MRTISPGFCQCGCGGRTALAERNYYSKGILKGQPQRYIYGHGTRARWKELDFGSDAARFAEYVYQDPNSGCSLYCGKEGVKGYGIFKFAADKKTTQAHRAAWILAGREIPEELHVLHKCDTPCCVNVDHLYVGTNQQNRRDMAARNRGAKGRLPFGVRRASAKKWAAQFWTPNNQGNRHLGLYDSLDQAAAVAGLVKAVAYGLRGLA